MTASVGSVRRIALLDGPEAGQEALAVSTGGGLSFWALLGRGLDIGPLWWRGEPVDWQHPAGIVAPQFVDRQGDGGRGVERGLGGMLVTCGLDHVRQPSGGYPLHGHHPFTPARLLACGERDGVLVVEGETVTFHLSRGGFRLRRRIEAPVGGVSVRVLDTVTNIGFETCELHLLYHWNLGPAWSGDAVLQVNGVAWEGPAGDAPEIVCRASGSAKRSDVTLDRATDGLSLRFENMGLPWLQVWRNPRLDVLAVEPCTSERRSDGRSGPGRKLVAGEAAETFQELSFQSRPPHRSDA